MVLYTFRGCLHNIQPIIVVWELKFWKKSVKLIKSMFLGQKSLFYIQNIGFRCSILHQSWVQTSCNGLKSNLYDSNGYKVWLCYQEVAKIRQMQWNFIFKWFKIMFIAILSEIGNLDGPCCTDPENKFVMIA